MECFFYRLGLPFRDPWELISQSCEVKIDLTNEWIVLMTVGVGIFATTSCQRVKCSCHSRAARLTGDTNVVYIDDDDDDNELT